MKKLKLKTWVKVGLAYIGIAVLTYLIALRFDYLIEMGY